MSGIKDKKSPRPLDGAIFYPHKEAERRDFAGKVRRAARRERKPSPHAQAKPKACLYIAIGPAARELGLSGVVVVGDIGGVFGEDISDDLIDGVIPLLLERVVHRGQNGLDLVALVLVQIEFARKIHLLVHVGTPPGALPVTVTNCS